MAGTYGLMKSVAPEIGSSRLARMLVSTTQRVRIAVAHGRLDAARSLRQAMAAAENDGGTDSSSPPEPTATPTPDPTPDDTSNTTVHEWRGELAASNTWDREAFHLRGNVHVDVRWSGTAQLVLWVQDPSGEVIEHRIGQTIDFRRDVSAGDYTFTVQQTAKDEVAYRVIIETGS